MRPPSLAIFGATLVVSMASCDGDDPTAPEIGPVAQMEVIGGNGQEAEAGTELPEALGVRLTDASGAPVAGQQVTFSVTAGGGSLFVPTAQTDANGEARNRWTLGTSTAEAHTVEARVVDSQTGEAFSATFTATALPGPPGQLEKASGDGQSAPLGGTLGDSLVVRVRDEFGNPVDGVEVAWTVTEGGGATDAATTITDGHGRAAVAWTLGSTPGEPQVVVASVEGLAPVTFSASATLEEAVFEIVSGDAQEDTIGATLPDSLVVVFRLSDGTPLPGVTVGWEVESGGGTVAPTESQTNESGLSASSWTLGSEPGAQEVSVTVEGLPPVRFSATAIVPTASLEIVGGDSQQDTVAASLSDSLVVRVELEDGRPLVGASVSWEVQSGGGAVSPSEASTDSAGLARVAWTLGPTAGTQTVRASVEGADPVTFSATASPGALATIMVAPDTVNFNALRDSLALSLTGADQFGNVRATPGPAWASRNEGVASVTTGGTVISEDNGAAWIVATSGSLTDSARVEVSQVPASVTVTPAKASLWVGEAQTFTASVKDANGFDVAGASIAWSSSDPAKATVSASGEATAIDGGAVSVTARSGGATGSVSLTVVDPVWEAVASLPHAVRAGGAATDGARVYLFGGSPQGDDGSSWNQQYDPAQDSWSLGVDLTSERQFAMAGGLSDGVHLVGGVTSPADVHEVYLRGFDSWEAEASLPAERWAGMSAVVGGKLYVIGGRSPSGATLQVADVFIYDPQTDSWTTGAPMPTARMSAAVGVIGGRIYVAGGQTSGIGTTDVLEVYDPASDSWANLTPMPAPREALGGGAFFGRFCVFGGRTATANPTGNAFPDTWCYDPETDVWHDGPHMLTPRVEVGSARFGGLLYGLGGRTPGAIAVATVERLKPF